MATKKITLHELRRLVKQVIKEESNNSPKKKRVQRGISEGKPEVISPMGKEILAGYLECALWTEEDELGTSTNIESDISIDSKIDAYKDIKMFLEKAGDLIEKSGLDFAQIGHDLWLTRNRHGVGFWDRGIGDVGDLLSNIAKDMGEKNAFWGDDGKIHIE